MQSLDRRTFVKNSGLAVGGLVLAPSLLAAKAHIDGSDAIKVGLIGCGGRGTGAAVQAMSTSQNVQLVAMADAFRDNVDNSYQQIKGELENNGIALDKLQVPEEHKFAGFDAYKKVIPLCDVVILATPPGFRPEHFEAAVKAGKHVFMEKPVAVDGPGVRRVLAAAQVAKEKKLNVVVGLQRHYQNQYLGWVELLQEGVIGDIVTSHVYWNGDGVWVRERKPGQTEMEYQMRNWYYFNWLCGDHITEQHIHNLDVSNWVKQAYPVKAQGMGGRQFRIGKDYGEIYDHHFVEFEYADGSRMFSQCRHIPNTQFSVTESFQGTSGFAPEPGVIKTRSGYVVLKHNTKNDPNPYQVEHDVLFEAIAKGEYRFADAENAAKSTLTSIMGRMATYSGLVIEWDAALNSEMDLMPEKLAWDANPKVLPGKDGLYPAAIPGFTKVL
ncbi:MAG TPA: Gfo/Idh/MocA family oxidoreductase [Saprospiraceae bacterium]|nr:Gfo/Idh/MocA family oxidoreductase [Saprospiraceae bacterium]HMQ84481.1 Gfo/Idh/MocA family oxidoreductase [Saprospiraceae bacterium]